MKKIILWGVSLLILAFIVTAFIASRNKSTLNSGEKNFAFSDTASITKVFIADKQNNSVLIEKNDSGKWKLNQKYEVMPEMLTELLRTIMYVSVSRPVSKAEHNSVITRMAAFSIKVEVYATVYTIDFLGIKLWPTEKLVRTYYVGDNTQDNTGTYMLMEDADMAFVVHIPGFKGFLHTRYSPFERDWRGHGIFKYTMPQVAEIVVEYPDFPDRSLILKNPGDGSYSVSNPINGTIKFLDTIRTINFINAFTDVRYETLIEGMSKTKRDSILTSKPFSLISVKDRNGVINTVTLFRIKLPEGSTNLMGDTIQFDQERLYGLIDGKELAIVQYFVFGPLLRNYYSFDKKQYPVEKQEQSFETIF